MADLDIKLEVHGVPLRFRLDKRSPVQASMAHDLLQWGQYERSAWRIYERTLRPGQTVVDVGAHVGVLTCLAAVLVGPTGRVHAFEPHADNRRRLLWHLRKNDLSWVTVHAEACSDGESRVPFYHCADNDGGHALWDPALSPGNTETRAHPRHQTVKTVRLDAVVPGPIDFLKIDTEGAELAVLQGAEGLLREQGPTIIAEINPVGLHHMGSFEAMVRGTLRQWGYAEFALNDGEDEPIALREDQTLDTRFEKDGRTYISVFNMLFTPPARTATDPAPRSRQSSRGHPSGSAASGDDSGSP